MADTSGSDGSSALGAGMLGQNVTAQQIEQALQTQAAQDKGLAPNQAWLTNEQNAFDTLQNSYGFQNSFGSQAANSGEHTGTPVAGPIGPQRMP
jgi:hypothetical protein